MDIGAKCEAFFYFCFMKLIYATFKNDFNISIGLF